MREIKFRGLPVEDIEENGWHVSKNEFVYGSLIVDGRTCFIVNGIVEIEETSFTFEQYVRVRPETVGQLTERKDKNGKDIWEFDRVRVVRYGGETNFTALVIFRSGRFKLLPDSEKGRIVNDIYLSDNFDCSEDMYTPACLEVIGHGEANDVWDNKPIKKDEVISNDTI